MIPLLRTPLCTRAWARSFASPPPRVSAGRSWLRVAADSRWRSPIRHDAIPARTDRPPRASLAALAFNLVFQHPWGVHKLLKQEAMRAVTELYTSGFSR